MGAFLFYLLKSGCCLVVFYIFFKLLMSRSTFFRFNRITLLVGLLGCTLLPLIELTTTEETFLHTPLYAIHEILQSTESVILNPEQMEDPILISEKNPEINSLNWIPVTLAFIYVVAASFLASLSSSSSSSGMKSLGRRPSSSSKRLLSFNASSVRLSFSVFVIFPTSCFLL